MLPFVLLLSLSEIAKIKLRSTSFISDLLFGGQIDKIYKENAEALKNNLISKTVTSSRGKPQASTSKSVKPEFKKPNLRPQNPKIHDKKSQSSYSKKTISSSREGCSRGSDRRDRGGYSRRGSISQKKF